MESKNEESGDPEYQRAFTALDEKNLASLKPLFKENALQDDVLLLMESEEELKKILTKELNLPFGHAFKFSRHWFNKYHKSAETLDSGIQPLQREEKPGHLHSEKVTTSTEKHEKTLFGSIPFANPCNLNEYSAQTQPPISTQVTDESDGVEDSITFKAQKQGNKDETITPTKEKESSKSHPSEFVFVSAPFLSLSKSQLKEGMLMDKRSCQPHHAELQPAQSSQEKAIFDAENRHDEPANAFVVNESSHKRVNLQEPVINIQDNTAADDITFKKCLKSPNEAENLENAHEETTIAITANDERYAISTVQAVHMNSNQSGSSDNKAKDSKDDPISEYQEESPGNKPPSTDVNKQEGVADQREDETRRKTTVDNNLETRTEKSDEASETTVIQANTETNVRNDDRLPRRDEKTVQLINDSEIARDQPNKVEPEVCIDIKNVLENREANEMLDSTEERQDSAGVQSDKTDEVDLVNGFDSSLLSDRDGQVMKEEEHEQATINLDVVSSTEEQTANSSSPSETTVIQANTETNVRTYDDRLCKQDEDEETVQLIDGSEISRDQPNRVESEVCLEIKNVLENREANEMLESTEDKQDPADVQSDKTDEVNSVNGFDSSLLSDRDDQVMKEVEHEQATINLDVVSSTEDQTANSSSPLDNKAKDSKESPGNNLPTSVVNKHERDQREDGARRKDEINNNLETRTETSDEASETTVIQANTETNVRTYDDRLPKRDEDEETVQLIDGSEISRDHPNKVESEVCLEIKNVLENREANEMLESTEERQDPAGVHSDETDEVDSVNAFDSSLLSDRDGQVMKEEEHEQATINLEVVSSSEDQTANSSGPSVNDRKDQIPSSGRSVYREGEEFSTMDERSTSTAVQKASSYFVVDNNGTEEKATVSSEQYRISEEKPVLYRTKTLSKSQRKKKKQETSKKKSGASAKTSDATYEKEHKNEEQSSMKVQHQAFFQLELGVPTDQTSMALDQPAAVAVAVKNTSTEDLSDELSTSLENLEQTGTNHTENRTNATSETEENESSGGNDQNVPSSSLKGDTCKPHFKQETIATQEQAEVAGLQNHSKKISRCNPRPRRIVGRDTFYEKGFVFNAEESREVEFKSFVSAQHCSLPWKIMGKAKKFICACLNADAKGTIYFGVGDSQEQSSRYHHGEILGLEIEEIKDDINKAFQFLLDHHIRSDAGPLQKGGEQNCVSIHFVPVNIKGNRSHLYIVEIEVDRDWRFCKDNIYYSKSWTEKRGADKDCAGRKALTDFFKVKDEFDDAAIRTNGASSCVKQLDVDRQIKKPLEVKYKDWRRKAKQGAREFPEEVTLDDAEAKQFNLVLRERLHELNNKEYGYILVANKMPAQYRGTAHLSFLQNIPWLAVFDLFDAASRRDGLHHACNETTDAKRARNKNLQDFNEVSPDSFVSTRGTTWISNNDEMQKTDWIKRCKDCMHRTLFAYKQCFAPGKLVCVFLGLSENAVEEMADIMESCFSILGDSAGSCVTIISENKSVAEAFIKASKPRLHKELKECSLAGIPWVLFDEIVREIVGPSKYDERDATAELPFYSGNYKKVLNKVINSWEDLEVYIPSPRLPGWADAIEKERYSFYKGAQASQTNLFHEHSIHRTLEHKILVKVDCALKSLCKTDNSAYQDGSDITCHVKTITVPYEPGSGATTLCRRILWKRRKDYRCAVVKAITQSTDYFIEMLQNIAYDEKNSNYSLPVLVLVDNFPESDARHLTERIMKRQTKCVVLTTCSIIKSATISSYDLTPLGKLDAVETSLVKNILINITNDAEQRREVEEVLDREQRFIWFGLELFGRDYLKIEERLKNHINSILVDSRDIQETLLNMCCFLYKYSEGYSILPHSVVLDFLYYSTASTKKELSDNHDIHEMFGGLLLQEQNETNGYYGWRPAHSLVSEVVTSRISMEDTAVFFLKEICKCKTYAVKFLRQQVFKLLLERKRISDPVFLKERGAYGSSDGSADLDDDVFGFSEVRTRYSPVIEDIVANESNTSGALRVLITICEEAIQTEEKSYAWQQLARFMGYQMRASEMNENDDLYKRLYKVMRAEKKTDPIPMPKTGLEAAHIAVDIAIHLQPNYSHHYVTKGVFYRWQLTESMQQPDLLHSLPGMIEICRKALEVYDKALKATCGHNHYSMIGKIQAIVSLLETVKALPCFGNKDDSFTRFLQTGEIPWEMANVLSSNDQEYVQNLSSTTLDLLNEVFGYVKLNQATTYSDSDESKIRGLNNARIKASELRRTFYKITGYDKRQFSVESSMPLSSRNEQTALNQQIVQDVLFIHDETPYSAWTTLKDNEIVFIYNLLKPICLRGCGRHNDLLIFSKACLQLKERPPVDELEEIVSKWVTKFPNSVWAHLFNYMIHFPIPNGSLAPYSQSTKSSIKQCENIVREQAGLSFRKSAAEYFLGKERGLNAIVNGQEFRWIERGKTKTAFWRRKEIAERLERVQGRKDVTLKGVITYQGIQLRFDDTLYPNESKDDLWFYIGFSVAGPYAYDPVDNDTYADISLQGRERTSDTVVHTFSLEQDTSKMSANLIKPVEDVKGPAPSGIVQTRSSPARTSTSFSTGGCQDDLPHDTRNFSNPSASISSSGLKSVSQQATLARSLYSSALQFDGRKNQSYKSASRLDMEIPPKTSDNWRRVNGTQGTRQKFFDPINADKSGKVHHGAYVLGLPKSKECTMHTGSESGLGAIKRCTFAHSWKSDTRQFVCTKCTDKKFTYCKNKEDHKNYIWNLGPYYNTSGTLWKASRSSK